MINSSRLSYILLCGQQMILQFHVKLIVKLIVNYITSINDNVSTSSGMTRATEALLAQLKLFAGKVS